MFGKNKITKKEKEYLGAINITEIFPTIQGEGIHSGRPCVFIRFQGCSLRCKFCDTSFDDGIPMSVEDILDEISYFLPPKADPLVVITGGEPFLQAGIVPLTIGLIDKGIDVQIETAGTHWQEGFNAAITSSAFHRQFTIICSPKTGRLNSTLEKWITAYKYVLIAGQVSEKDGLPNVSPETGKKLIIARPSDTTENRKVYVMPCDAHDEEQNARNLQVTVESSLHHGHTLCLQIHKIIGVE